MTRATVSELDPVKVKGEADDDSCEIRVFTLTLQGATVELSSLGASITRLLLPSSAAAASHDGDGGGRRRSDDDDDVVLGYNSHASMWETKNPPYFCVTVGRVANRIAKGSFQLEDGGEVYRLEKNNGPNHLHGGSGGFSNRIWEASIVKIAAGGDHDSNEEQEAFQEMEAVQFTLLSRDGEQGYPGSVRVTATYSLQPVSDHSGVTLCLSMEASLQGNKPTPINLAQHSYFCLSRHNDPRGILDHRLTLYCDAYTPMDETSIPTRTVQSLSADPAMDFRQGRLLRDALVEYGALKAGLSRKKAEEAVRKSRISPDIALAGASSPNPGSTYGFDHNYVVRREGDGVDGLHTIGILEHETSERRMTVRSDAPGVQLYTGNYLDGVSLSPEVCKDSAVYCQWQALCLETQHFPDSILVDVDKHPDFAEGRCVVLRPEQPQYKHRVEYEFEYNTRAQSDEITDDSMMNFRGIDSEGNKYASVQEMWQSLGVVSDSMARTSWYDRAARYYEDNCEATIDGVLGGFASLSNVDLEGSKEFIQELERIQPSFQWTSGAACECGAGIGRASKGLLLPLGVPRCDLVESNSRILSASPDYLGDDASRCRFYCIGLQDWSPSPSTYSIVWIQWILCYLTDDDAVRFLRRCRESLVHGGLICLKENTCTDEDFVLDLEDASVTRSVTYLKQLATKAGLHLLYEMIQTDFPSDIYPVPMLAFDADGRQQA